MQKFSSMAAFNIRGWLPGVLGALGLFLLCYQGEVRGEERERTFIRALDAFEAATKPSEFLGAAVLFESILVDGHESEAVLYNLGNAYMRGQQPGKAIAAYRRAHRHNPRNPYLDVNLLSALDAAPSKLKSPEASWWHLVLFWHDSLSQSERQWVSALFWSLAFLVALTRLLMGPKENKKRLPGLKWMLIATLAAGVLSAVSVGLGYQQEVLTRHGVIISESKARAGNGESYALAFDKALEEGAEFTVVESRDRWILIKIPDVGEGWVPGKNAVIY